MSSGVSDDAKMKALLSLVQRVLSEGSVDDTTDAELRKFESFLRGTRQASPMKKAEMPPVVPVRPSASATAEAADAALQTKIQKQLSAIMANVDGAVALPPRRMSANNSTGRVRAQEPLLSESLTTRTRRYRRRRDEDHATPVSPAAPPVPVAAGPSGEVEEILKQLKRDLGAAEGKGRQRQRHGARNGDGGDGMPPPVAPPVLSAAASYAAAATTLTLAEETANNLVMIPSSRSKPASASASASASAPSVLKSKLEEQFNQMQANVAARAMVDGPPELPPPPKLTFTQRQARRSRPILRPSASAGTKTNDRETTHARARSGNILATAANGAADDDRQDLTRIKARTRARIDPALHPATAPAEVAMRMLAQPEGPPGVFNEDDGGVPSHMPRRVSLGHASPFEPHPVALRPDQASGSAAPPGLSHDGGETTPGDIAKRTREPIKRLPGQFRNEAKKIALFRRSYGNVQGATVKAMTEFDRMPHRILGMVHEQHHKAHQSTAGMYKAKIAIPFSGVHVPNNVKLWDLSSGENLYEKTIWDAKARRTKTKASRARDKPIVFNAQNVRDAFGAAS